VVDLLANGGNLVVGAPIDAGTGADTLTGQAVDVDDSQCRR